MIETKHFTIHGKVQGVGFRAAMYREAIRFNVTGWVRNRHDGTVEAVLQGPEKSVAGMLAWARHGPRGARVDQVDVETVDGIFTEFDLLSTA
ncbi:MAG: acylphosphatase [Pseudomonadota bacterium]|nr:acylphosphatase [Pseudomonadota bacterium]